MNVLQIEPGTTELGEGEEKLKPFLHDERERTLFERLYLDELRRKISELFTYIPKMQVRTSYIQPQSIIGTILYSVEKHLKAAKTLYERKSEIKQEKAEIGHLTAFLSMLDALFKETHAPPSIDIIGLTIKDPSAVDHVRSLVAKMTGGNFKLFTVPAGDGSLAGLITIEKSIADSVSRGLNREQIPELSFPPAFDILSLSGKINYLESRTLVLSMEIEAIDKELEELGRRWIPLYHNVMFWLDERIALLAATATIYQTQMCFYLRGWMPSDDVQKLKAQLEASFSMQVVMEEKHVREKELEHAPIILTNPPYFKPFELLSRMLPLPSYSSLDATPYIGIFFPLIFGMILGDAGYGVLLAILSIVLIRRFAKNKNMVDASKILLIASIYTMLFGFLYGELFGDLGNRLFGLEPLLIERRTSVVPMMVFALSVGVVHILLGLVLGVITAFKKHVQREAIYKLLNIAVIVGLVAVFASFFGFFPELLSKPIIVGILIAVPFLFFSGGILAPLELLKSMGNIISYVRIMAIGLTSVLLAYVANQLAGAMGNVVLGFTVAALLHVLNIILGVFSPTIHTLRLHYVEFFSKFVESGGQKFEPLKK